MIVICVLSAIFVGASAQSNESRLIGEFLTNYTETNRISRPVLSDNETVNVSLHVMPQQILSMKNGFLKISSIAMLKWKDANLTWNESSYGNVTNIKFPANKIWLPDLKSYDGHIEHDTVGNVVVKSNGTVWWLLKTKVTMPCRREMSVLGEHYNCSIRTSSWLYDHAALSLDFMQVKMPMVSRGLDMSQYKYSPEWKVVRADARRSVHEYECCPGYGMYHSSIAYNMMLVKLSEAVH